MFPPWAPPEFCPVLAAPSSNAKSHSHCTLPPPKAWIISLHNVAIASRLGRGVALASQDCHSYPLQCLFPQYAVKIRYCNHSPEVWFLWSCFFCVDVVKFLFLRRGQFVEASIQPSCSASLPGLYALLKYIIWNYISIKSSKRCV